MIFFKCYDSLLQVPFCEDESVQLFRVAFFRRDFLQNPYFRILHAYYCGKVYHLGTVTFYFNDCRVWTNKAGLLLHGRARLGCVSKGSWLGPQHGLTEPLQSQCKRVLSQYRMTRVLLCTPAKVKSYSFYMTTYLGYYCQNFSQSL